MIQVPRENIIILGQISWGFSQIYSSISMIILEKSRYVHIIVDISVCRDKMIGPRPPYTTLLDTPLRGALRRRSYTLCVPAVRQQLPLHSCLGSAPLRAQTPKISMVMWIFLGIIYRKYYLEYKKEIFMSAF